MHFEYMTKYLDYRELGFKVRGAGFVRLECWGNTCNLTMQVSGLVEVACGRYPVTLVGAERHGNAGEIRLENGRGRLELKDLNCESLAGMNGFSVLDVERVVVALDGKRELVAVLREEKREDEPHKLKPEVMPMAMKDVEEVRTGKTEDLELEETRAGKTEDMEMKEVQAANLETMKGLAQVSAEETGKDKVEIPNKNEVPSYAMRGALRPGKWEQLKSIYPTISPFGDSRNYLQISPGDFVILKERSYRMVNNSFLLHGYFTYKHLILHKMEQKGETRYYVGVPGSFYDKEKEVAILFGFESFEGAAEPTREGDFGYYMMRVEL